MLETEQSDKLIIHFKPPKPDDGYLINQLIAKCPPLDTNSVYCNLLQCTHFSNTSVCAVQNKKLVGFISAYLLPQRPNTLFIWQVAVDESARGKGIAIQMLLEILQRPFCEKVNYIETTITNSNKPSWTLFNKLAKRLKTDTEVSTAFHEEKHFNGLHESEQLMRIGPIL